MDNIFFDKSKLKSCGTNVIIGKTVRIRYPELVEIGDNVIIDDFTYISTSLKLHSFVHISAGSKLIGGANSHIEIKSYSTLAPNVVLAAGSDDYLGGIATPLVPVSYKGNIEVSSILINKHCIIGSCSVVLPGAIFNEGASLGALSLAKGTLNEYSLYAGIPAKKIKTRRKIEILELEKIYEKS